MARETIVFRDNFQYADTASFLAAWPNEEVAQMTWDLINWDRSVIGPRWTDGPATVHMELLPVGIVLGEAFAYEFRSRTIAGLDPDKSYVVRAAFHMDANYPFDPRAGIEVRGRDGNLRRAYSILADGTDYLGGDRTNQWEILELITRPHLNGDLVIALGGWHIVGIMPRQCHWGLVEVAELAPGPADDFMLEPDGAFSIVESIAYLTDIAESQRGHEQRRRLRTLPRLRQALTIQRFDDEAALVDAKLHDNLDGDWYVPWWLDQSVLEADISVAATVIQCETTGYRFVEGEEIVVWRTDTQYERRVIAASGLATPGEITVTAGFSSAWPADGRTVVMPVKRCRLVDDEHRVGRAASFVSTRPLVFEEMR